jgi:hypothetical protein
MAPYNRLRPSRETCPSDGKCCTLWSGVLTRAHGIAFTASTTVSTFPADLYEIHKCPPALRADLLYRIPLKRENKCQTVGWLRVHHFFIEIPPNGFRWKPLVRLLQRVNKEMPIKKWLIVMCGTEPRTLTNKKKSALLTWERKILGKIHGPLHENGYWKINNQEIYTSI